LTDPASRPLYHLSLHDALPISVATDPELYSVAFENDRVRVLFYSDHPGDRTHPHEHPDSVMVTASSFERRLHHDGQSVDVTIPADRKSTRLNSSHVKISYAVFC